MPKPLDLAGKRFGKLTALDLAHPKPSGMRGRVWRCSCECGSEKAIEAHALTSGGVTHCGCSKGDKNVINITGMRFGILTAVELSHRPEGGQGAHWRCSCDCGGTTVVRSKDLRNGNTASCGCKKPYRGKTAPVLDINRPWRKADQVDDRWLVLVGERCPKAA